MKVCNVHSIEFVHKTGVSKNTNKPYDFWCCPETLADGSYCQDKGIENGNYQSAKAFKNSVGDNRSQRIERQHSQDMAIQFISLLVETGQIKEVTSNLVEKYTKHFENDLESN